MIEAGYPPAIREKGIVKWQKEKDSSRTCEIYFQSFRGLYWTGYIGVNFCDCDDKLVFEVIINTFEKEIIQRNLTETPQRQLFNRSS